jgi:hypothetical protein
LFSSGARITGDGRILVDRAKPYTIPKREIWAAYKRVRANQGAAGVDGQTIADFEADLSNNLYKLWKSTRVGRPRQGIVAEVCRLSLPAPVFQHM